MKMLTKAIARQLPRRYGQDGEGDAAIVYAKWFDPIGTWRWFALEATPIGRDGEVIDKPLADVLGTNELADVEFFGLVSGHEVELGYWRLSELEGIANGSRTHRLLGLGIERDLHFEPAPLGAVRAWVDAARF